MSIAKSGRAVVDVVELRVARSFFVTLDPEIAFGVGLHLGVALSHRPSFLYTAITPSTSAFATSV